MCHRFGVRTLRFAVPVFVSFPCRRSVFAADPHLKDSSTRERHILSLALIEEAPFTQPSAISVESLLLASFEILMIATGLSRLLFYPIPALL